MPTTTSFTILSAITVKSNYRWDGVYPALDESVDVGTNGIVGNSPGLSAVFSNNSVVEDVNDLNYYVWDFGDYYNQSTNVAYTTSISDSVSHLYIMPGIYTVTLTRNTFKLNTIQSINTEACKDRNGIYWNWSSVLSSSDISQNITWDQTKSSASKPKTWISNVKCLGKYCTYWYWNNLQADSVNHLTWRNISSLGGKTSTWNDIKHVSEGCKGTDETQAVYTLQVSNASLPNMITLFDIKPVAFLECKTVSYGENPLTVQITPSSSLCGSFPIEKIVWDFGDGSEEKIVSRYDVPESIFTYTSAISSDIYDPRNYDLVHTYRISSANVFYPSIRVYGMNSVYYDTAKTVVGPITYPSISSINLLKVRNLDGFNTYGVQIGEDFSLLKIDRI